MPDENPKDVRLDGLKEHLTRLTNVGHVFRTLGWQDKAMKPGEELDYVGCWEDAFLYAGFENGKYNFLTSAIAQTVQRHGIHIECDYPEIWFWQKREKNDIIVSLKIYGKETIPEKTIHGEKVVKGITPPREYLPDVVQKLFDAEFGYDKDFEGTQRIFNVNGSFNLSDL